MLKHQDPTRKRMYPINFVILLLTSSIMLALAFENCSQSSAVRYASTDGSSLGTDGLVPVDIPPDTIGSSIACNELVTSK